MTDLADRPDDKQRGTDFVPHQRFHERFIDEMLDGRATENTAIADLTPITGGQSPTEQEHNDVITAVNDILAALRSAKVLPTE